MAALLATPALAPTPTGFLSATLVWVLTGEPVAAVAPPNGLLLAANVLPPVAVGAFFLSSTAFLARSLAEGFTPFTMRFWAAPGRDVAPAVVFVAAVPAVPGRVLVAPTPLALALGSAALPFVSLAAGGAVGFSGCCGGSSGCVGGGACCCNSSSSIVVAAAAAASGAEASAASASVGSMVAMATPSGFIP